MSPPTPEQEDAALAALSGTVTETRPAAGLQRNMLRLRLVMDAQRNGASWQMIGQALGGISGKAAKRQMKLLAARTQRQLLASKGPRPSGNRPWVHEMGETREPMFTVEGPGVRPAEDPA
jgi:hypothetical protein